MDECTWQKSQGVFATSALRTTNHNKRHAISNLKVVYSDAGGEGGCKAGSLGSYKMRNGEHIFSLQMQSF